MIIEIWDLPSNIACFIGDFTQPDGYRVRGSFSTDKKQSVVIFFHESKLGFLKFGYSNINGFENIKGFIKT